MASTLFRLPNALTQHNILDATTTQPPLLIMPDVPPSNIASATSSSSTAPTSSSSSASSTKPVGAIARHTAAIAARSTEPQSWSESLQRYNTQDRRAPVHSSLTPAPKHGVYNNSIQPATFHPVRQVYTSESKENQIRDTEKQQSTQALQQARHRHDNLANAKGYNILTGTIQTTNTALANKLHTQDTAHRTKIEVDESTGKRVVKYTQPYNHPAKREYNIVNNKQQIVVDPSAAAAASTSTEKKSSKGTKQSDRNTKESREYNIVSNNILPSYSAKHQAAERASRDALREKYFAASHYNPITLQFTHPAEESRYQTQKQRIQASYGQDQLNSLPTCIKRSEGQCYDIIAPGIVKDSLQLSLTYDQRDKEAREARQMKYAKEKELYNRDIESEGKEAVRALNRVSQKRFQQSGAQGYDMLSNQPK